jgi:hypothetical protein
VALIVGKEWWPLPAAAVALWVAKIVPATTAAAAAALVLMVVVEEYAHLAAVAHLCPTASLALAVRRPLRVRAEASARLDPDDAAAVALAGPVAAAAAGAVVLTVPLGTLNLLLRTAPSSYADLALLLLPLFYAALSALPLPGSDAAVVLGALRRRHLPVRPGTLGRRATLGRRPGTEFARWRGRLGGATFLLHRAAGLVVAACRGPTER